MFFLENSLREKNIYHNLSYLLYNLLMQYTFSKAFLICKHILCLHFTTAYE